MVELIDTLRREHRDITRLLDALAHQIEVFAGDSRPDYDIVSGVADYFLDYPDLCHHPKENAIFRAISARRPNDIGDLGDLLLEHRGVHDHAVRFRGAIAALLNEAEISRSAIVGAAHAFLDAQREHMRFEEARFFPLAERLLEPDDWSRIREEIDEVRDPVFGEAVEDRFAALRDRLLAWEREFRIG